MIFWPLAYQFLLLNAVLIVNKIKLPIFYEISTKETELPPLPSEISMSSSRPSPEPPSSRISAGSANQVNPAILAIFRIVLS